MELKKKTFEDLLGNVADDAKQAFDEILERPGAKNTTEAGVGQGLTNTAGNVAGTAGGLAGAAGNVTGAAGDLTALPGHIAHLSELIEKLLPAVETLTGTISNVNPVSGGAGSKATARRSSS